MWSDISSVMNHKMPKIYFYGFPNEISEFRFVEKIERARTTLSSLALLICSVFFLFYEIKKSRRRLEVVFSHVLMSANSYVSDENWGSRNGGKMLHYSVFRLLRYEERGGEGSLASNERKQPTDKNWKASWASVGTFWDSIKTLGCFRLQRWSDWVRKDLVKQYNLKLVSLPRKSNEVNWPRIFDFLINREVQGNEPSSKIIQFSWWPNASSIHIKPSTVATIKPGSLIG